MINIDQIKEILNRKDAPSISDQAKGWIINRCKEIEEQNEEKVLEEIPPDNPKKSLDEDLWN